MSSGFVSGGTNDESVQRDDAWLRAQQELEEERRRKADVGKQDGGKSLYEVLQQNKMAKQEAFEEKTKLRNQFRSLDEDEVEFLDSVLESTRAQEAAVKKDTADQLEAFRKQREEAEKVTLGSTDLNVAPAEHDEWSIPARKRRREKKDLLLPGKKRKASEAGAKEGQAERKSSQSGDVKNDKDLDANSAKYSGDTRETSTASEKKGANDKSQPETKELVKPAPAPASTGLGLVGYGSDSDSG
ncbi:hypothetical protein N7532_005980 [Penicillium argentinense]|uniref:FAM192A/Fyv6 N-terminal domain-containing protein n=1 Tax=Penicillium argentinense TaxID=1131581 RepID=A0A9W9FF17_9EURO|nr:uncharacterized protein N7532_005980 [Penicillium argentinense]KAJ5098979.1 hypothetical protein N7532_005980 [Penicillium argentinense]